MFLLYKGKSQINSALQKTDLGLELHKNAESTFKITNCIEDILNAYWQILDEDNMIDPSSCSNNYSLIHSCPNDFQGKNPSLPSFCI